MSEYCVRMKDQNGILDGAFFDTKTPEQAFYSYVLRCFRLDIPIRPWYKFTVTSAPEYDDRNATLTLNHKNLQKMRGIL